MTKAVTTLLPTLYRRAFWLLLVLVIFSLAAYFSAMVGLIASAVAHDTDLKVKAKVMTDITTLEANYFRLTGHLTLDYAYQLGFKDSGETMVFVNRPAETITMRPAPYDF